MRNLKRGLGEELGGSLGETFFQFLWYQLILIFIKG